MSVKPVIFLLVIVFTPLIYRNWSCIRVEKKPSICCGDMPPYDSITYMVGRFSFGKISIGILIALSTANIKRLMVITITVIGLFSAVVTIDIVCYFNSVKILLTLFSVIAFWKSAFE